MLSSLQIEKAKKETLYSDTDRYHENDDCIRIAYEWLDAQKKIKSLSSKRNLASIIAIWAGRYVSSSDVEVAAHIHPKIFGSDKCYNISAKLTEPKKSRLKHIAQAQPKMQNTTHQDPYTHRENQNQSRKKSLRLSKPKMPNYLK